MQVHWLVASLASQGRIQGGGAAVRAVAPPTARRTNSLFLGRCSWTMSFKKVEAWLWLCPAPLKTSWLRCWWCCLITRTNWSPSLLPDLQRTLRWADDTLAYMYKGGGAGDIIIVHFLVQYQYVWWSLLGVSSTLLHTDPGLYWIGCGLEQQSCHVLCLSNCIAMQ